MAAEFRDGTPVQGVPVPGHGETFEGATGSIPQHIPPEQTDRMVAAMLDRLAQLEAMSENTPIPGQPPPPTPQQVIEQALGHIVEKHAGPPHKRVLGMTGPDLVKFVLAMVVAIATAYYGMKFAIERNTGQIEANESRIEGHQDAHQKVDERLHTLERATDRVEVKQDQTLDAIRSIREGLKRDHRRRR